MAKEKYHFFDIGEVYKRFMYYDIIVYDALAAVVIY
jgi:hypothetical protein